MTSSQCTHKKNGFKNGLRFVKELVMLSVWFILFCRSLDFTPLCANCLWRGSKTRFSYWEVLIYTKQFKRLILLLYLSINLSIVLSINTGIVCELHSSADFIESALSAQWIIQYEVNTSLSIDVFHFQWHFYLQSVQWLWLNAYHLWLLVLKWTCKSQACVYCFGDDIIVTLIIIKCDNKTIILLLLIWPLKRG